ncbi:MAG: UDP-2,3-diacylglucosamine hydrolase, partial [Sulfuricurvum sp.]|nr:UDP-2,3-diacylglucosamine hydrolase [Sulfuricurvum sp.]
MSPKQLHEGAILVADSHYASWRTPFIDFLDALECGEIQTTQLVLMGDNFDLLFGPVTQTLHDNRDSIERLNRLSQKIEIIYLEGNHDFRLTSIFPDIYVVGRSQQPLILTHSEQRIALLHGDLKVPFGYSIYTSLIRNRSILFCLNIINMIFNGIIINTLSKQMQRKNHCQKIENFEIIANRHKGTSWGEKCEVIIEGHYHQNRTFDLDGVKYYNLGAFACNERYYVVKFLQDRTIIDE